MKLVHQLFAKNCFLHWHLEEELVSFVPFEMLLCVYDALVQPHFDYCSVVWGNYNKSLSIQLQNCGVHISTSSSYDANVDDLFVRLGWQ